MWSWDHKGAPPPPADSALFAAARRNSEPQSAGQERRSTVVPEATVFTRVSSALDAQQYREAFCRKKTVEEHVVRHEAFERHTEEDIEAKKLLAEAPKRRSHIRAAATSGNVDEVLSFLEKIHDPQEATRLVKDAHKCFTKSRHVEAAQQLEEECSAVFWREDAKREQRSDHAPALARASVTSKLSDNADNFGSEAGGAAQQVQYNPNTGQIATGRIGTLRVHIDRGTNLPVRDSTSGSSDPFVNIKLYELEETDQGVLRHCVEDVKTDIKLMTLNPVFDEKFDLHINRAQCELDLTLYDWDEDGTHDFLGKIVLPLRELVEDVVHKRDKAWADNLRVAATVAGTAGSNNVVGRSLGGAGTTDINRLYGTVTHKFGTVGWDNATGIKAVATAIERSTQFRELKPYCHHENLKGIAGIEDSTDGGKIIFTTQFVPSHRSLAIANVPMFPRKTLEHITPLTPANKLTFEDPEFLHSSLADDATFAKVRTLTEDVMWPKAPVQASNETTLNMRRSLAYLTWRNLIEPTRPYKKSLPPGVCKDPKSGLDEIEEKAYKERRHDEDVAIRLADRLWGQQAGRDEGMRDKLKRVSAKALEARAYSYRKDSSVAIAKGRAEFDGHRYRDAAVHFERALKIASDGQDREMIAECHKWLGDSWSKIGEFRKARFHSLKHLELNSTVSRDQRLQNIEGKGVGEKKAIKAACREAGIKGADREYVMERMQKASEITVQSADPKCRVPTTDISTVVQQARAYNSEQYWVDRARVRLDHVNWDEGASRLTMDIVSGALHDMKRERAGEQKPVYVKASMWGEQVKLSDFRS